MERDVDVDELTKDIFQKKIQAEKESANEIMKRMFEKKREQRLKNLMSERQRQESS